MVGTSGARTGMTGADSILVEAPARLHLGFLDLHGGLGRRFGSLGLTIDTYATRLRACAAEGFEVSGAAADADSIGRAARIARDYAQRRGFAGGLHINLEKTIPDHVGLGSGTQMSLAIGVAMEHLYGQSPDCREVARVLQRGARSGIGVAAFAEGGFILDCGRGQDAEIPPVAARLPFPEAWCALLIFDIRGKGLHGRSEVDAFAELPEFPAESAGHLCRLAVMQALPGILEQDLDALAPAIGELQRVVGDHFAPAQGGRFTSPEVTAALDWCEAQGFAGVGQSSWGPTGFVLAPERAVARQLQAELKRRFGDLSPLRYSVVHARNHGALVEPASAPARLRQN